MTNIDKIRAALNQADVLIPDFSYLKIRNDEGLAALAELEQTTGDPCPVCGWRTVLAWGCEKCERDELCKRMDALVELGREPTPKECERIARESTMTMSANTTFEEIGRAMFRAVRAVIGGES